MKDVLGREVAVGDKVVIACTGYRNLQTGVIVKLTPKGVKISCKANSWGAVETFRAPDMFVKMETPSE